VKIAVAGFGMVLLAATPGVAAAAGFEQVAVPDPGGAPLEAGVWYPSDAPRAAATTWAF